MDFESIRKYWDDRASLDQSAQSTTQDVFLREIEARVLAGAVRKYDISTILDVGCGDARTTSRLASEFKDKRFTGFDYAQSMVTNSKSTVASLGLTNVELFQHDATKPFPVEKLDMAYTTRCLINLPGWDLQKQAIDNIYSALGKGGIYIMIENFVEGQSNFNALRARFDLPEIAIRDHNLFFEQRQTEEYLANHFTIEESTNISSTYYMVSRIIYSAICASQGTAPDYFDRHHELAAQLPFAGEYGPVRMLCLRKK
jgi:SAM-dependent methyltransferase